MTRISGLTLEHGVLGPTRRPLPRHRSAIRAAAPKPQWVKDLEADAEYDGAAARVLDGTDGDPKRILQNIRAEQQLKQQDIVQARTGSAREVNVRFRDVDPFNLWIWMEFYSAPSVSDTGMLNDVIRAWFLVGKLGGFNALNLQVSFNATDSVNCFRYDRERASDSIDCLMHEMDQLEFNGLWGRFRVDMGTADELCIDVLINMMATFSREYVGLKTLLIGGENVDWPVPSKKKPGIEHDPGMQQVTKRAAAWQRQAEREAAAVEEQQSLQTLKSTEFDEPLLDDLIGADVDLNDESFP